MFDLYVRETKAVVRLRSDSSLRNLGGEYKLTDCHLTKLREC